MNKATSLFIIFVIFYPNLVFATEVEKYLPERENMKITSNEEVNYLVEESIRFQYTESNHSFVGQITTFRTE